MQPDLLSESKISSTCNLDSSQGCTSLIQRKLTQSIKKQKLIGSGRYGQVYYATDNANRQLAIKTFPSHLEENFVNEAKIMEHALMNHQNLANFYFSDIVDYNGMLEYWIVCEFYEFGSLYDYIYSENEIAGINSTKMTNLTVFSDLNDMDQENFQMINENLDKIGVKHQMEICTLDSDSPNKPRRLTPKQVTSFIECIISGLAFLHSESVVSTKLYKPAIAHRDLKSKNILIKQDQLSCVIGDLGLAISYTSINNPEQKILGLPSSSHEIQGTIRYLPPEVLNGSLNFSNFNNFLKADVYTFGLVCYEIITAGSEIGHVLPYSEFGLGRRPILEEITSLVVDQNKRPSLAPVKNHEFIKTLIQESWHANSNIRPTAQNLLKRILKFNSK